jgi:hypothetical protein
MLLLIWFGAIEASRNAQFNTISSFRNISTVIKCRSMCVAVICEIGLVRSKT